jgi:hypothetical protein
MEASQYDLPLIDPTEPRILPQDGRVWFAVCRHADDRMRQHCYPLAVIEPTLRALRHAIDTYLSQGTFAVPTRRTVHLAWLTHAYVDLDSYKSDKWRDLTSDEMVREIIWHCDDADIPPPSVILTSGRGYYCKWFWTHPVPRAEAGRALAVNRALCRALAVFKADPNATDLSRILRVAGTVNGKNHAPVEIVWLNGPPGEPTTYDFDAFVRELPRPNIDDIKAEAGELPHGYYPNLGLRESRRILWGSWEDRQRYTFSREHWHWGVLEDIRQLAALRHPGNGGIVVEGARDLFGHLAACQLARVIKPGPLFHEIVAICRGFLPTSYLDATSGRDSFRRHCSTLLDRAMHAAEGELVEFRGRLRTPIYTYTKARIIDTLGITSDEMRRMSRLIDDGEKYRRKVETRRAAGMVERAAYEAKAAERRPMVAAMRARGMTWRAIAAELGVSVGEAHRLGEP